MRASPPNEKSNPRKKRELLFLVRVNGLEPLTSCV